MEAQQQPSPLAAGTRLDAYEITGVVVQGRYYTTYQARDGGGAEVLIKEFLPQEFAIREDGTVRARDPDDRTPLRFWLRSFLDQAQLLQKLNHPGLVRILRQFDANGTGYQVSEKLAGEPLAAILERNGTLGEAQLRRMLAPVLSGLEQAHAIGLVHRDIRPEHLLVRTDDVAVLTDFGVLRAPVRFKARSVFGSGQPPYAAPEEFYMAGPHGPWTDLYALGAVAYRIIAGQPPPDSRSRASGPPLAPLTVAAQVRCSEALGVAVDQALVLSAERRPQSVAAWRALLQGEAAAATAVAPVPQMDMDIAPPPSRPRSAVPLVVGAAVVIVAAAGAWYWLHPQPAASAVPAPVVAERGGAAAEPAPAAAAVSSSAAASTPAPTGGGASLDQLAQDLMDKEKKLADARDQLAQHAQQAAQTQTTKPDPGKSKPAAGAASASDGEPAVAPAAPADPEAAKLKQLQDEVDRLRKEREAQQAAQAAAASTTATRPQTASGPDYQSWYRQATASVRQSLDYPKSSLQDGEEGEITVKVHLRRDGTILGTQIQQRSSYAALNREATEVFSRIGRMQPVPPEYSPGNNEFDVSMPITFKMGE